MSLEQALERSITELANVGTVPDGLAAVCSASEAAEVGALALARSDLAGGPGYLAAADALAAARHELERWTSTPARRFSTAAHRQTGDVNRLVNRLVTATGERLTALVEVADTTNLAVALGAAREAVALAERALGGPVRDDATLW